MKKILVISNGKGEDSIAVTILNELRNSVEATGVEIKALPVVGNGKGYSSADIEVVGSTEILPSGGFPLQKLTVLFKDIKAGLLATPIRHLHCIKQETPDFILAVGDIYPVLLGLLAKRPVIHIGTAYSVYLRSIMLLERWLFKKCLLVISRDRATAEHLCSKGIKAQYLGNAMMDDPLLDPESPENALPTAKRIIGLVPSSRIDAYDNLARMLEVVDKLPAEQSKGLTFVVPAAPSLDLERIKIIVNEYSSRMDIIIFTGSLGEAIRKSILVIGMTGTGNEQVSGLKTPLVLLSGSGPQSSAKRLKHYENLLGEAVFVPRGSTQKIGEQIGQLLSDKKRMARMGRVGAERMGESGGARRIAGAISAYFKKDQTC
ncbi:lipid-A-disaccharide synthase-related protein [Candidatus Margulisiibacteriota bacterium]